jgi:hypothetical protein
MPPKPLLAFHATPSNMDRNTALLEVTPATRKVIALVRMQFA